MLLAFVRRRVSRQCRRRGESDAVIEAARNVLDPNVLTIGFGRRFATYKRANLLFNEIDQIADLLADSDRPIQLIFAGKAHPKDEPGKRFIKEIANLRHDPRFAGRVAFVEDYDINVCRHLIQGVDVWLNNPRRPLGSIGHERSEGRPQRRLELSASSTVGGPKPTTATTGSPSATAPATSMMTSPTPATPKRCMRRWTIRSFPCYYDRDTTGFPKHGSSG